jgi:hypothetical protein
LFFSSEQEAVPALAEKRLAFSVGFGYLLSYLFPLKWRLQAMLPAEDATGENEDRPESH